MLNHWSIPLNTEVSNGYRINANFGWQKGFVTVNTECTACQSEKSTCELAFLSFVFSFYVNQIIQKVLLQYVSAEHLAVLIYRINSLRGDTILGMGYSIKTCKSIDVM